MIVFRAGIPHASITWYAPPKAAGPLVGHTESNAGHRKRFVATPVPSPPSQGTE